MLQTIEFVDALRATGSNNLGIDLRDLGIVLHLMRNHVSGRLTTMSSLAAASGLSYGTAFRAIEGLVANSLIVRRPRTATGRSFSLHPSSELLRRWQLFAGHTRRLIEPIASDASLAARKPTADMAAVIAPPTVLANKLATRSMARALKATPTTQGCCRKETKRSAYVISTPKADWQRSIPIAALSGAIYMP